MNSNHTNDLSPFTDAYGTARTIIAASTLLTLAANDIEHLFPHGTHTHENGTLQFGWSLFVLSPSLRLAQVTGILILVVVASGWRPRMTGALHAWVCLSLTHSAAVIDGGDHVAHVLSLLMLPLTLLDDRRWHWERPENSPSWKKAAGRVFMWGIRLQICWIYLEAFASKFGVAEWRDGTALYYWIHDPIMGSGPIVRWVVAPIVLNSVALPLSTWSVLLLEFFLAAGLVIKNELKPPLLLAGVLFHAGIALLHGITSFAVIMIGALILYLRDEPFNWVRHIGREVLGEARG